MGRRVILTQDRWQHITFRHPEIGSDPLNVIECLENPDEVYVDERNALHAIIRQKKDFLLVIYELQENEGYIWTSYIINRRRKERRYGKLHRLEPS